MTDQQKPPPGLGTAGRRLWRQVTAEATEDGLELDSRERIWLHSAAKLTDRVVALEAAMADAELVVKGYNGQPVAHPLLTEIRQHHLLICQTLARLKVDTAEPAAGVLGVVGGSRQRAAANRRWRGPGA
ncbi:hypothetical protein [Mycobacterium talmoniae]|uniref:Terminase n=1 Tax=Mycobacterium talmoniae TaxID=1858794 RepID=A0A1S1NJ53_9MYCO|nr:MULTISPECIES: hypothetical protein [Mycobacterium]OHV03888.1 hypothetical protein BKN37_12720 [Mycobacterium talmoniae]PQM48069.1 hypothetical protein C1Y40_01704 [Mycobacterium talmoniae]TDH51570.1 hypothetical protein E2F47_15930 [Mycobacterium eburneum]